VGRTCWSAGTPGRAHPEPGARIGIRDPRPKVPDPNVMSKNHPHPQWDAGSAPGARTPSPGPRMAIANIYQGLKSARIIFVFSPLVVVRRRTMSRLRPRRSLPPPTLILAPFLRLLGVLAVKPNPACLNPLCACDFHRPAWQRDASSCNQPENQPRHHIVDPGHIGGTGFQPVQLVWKKRQPDRPDAWPTTFRRACPDVLLCG